MGRSGPSIQRTASNFPTFSSLRQFDEFRRRTLEPVWAGAKAEAEARRERAATVFIFIGIISTSKATSRRNGRGRSGGGAQGATIASKTQRKRKKRDQIKRRDQTSRSRISARVLLDWLVAVSAHENPELAVSSAWPPETLQQPTRRPVMDPNNA